MTMKILLSHLLTLCTYQLALGVNAAQYEVNLLNPQWQVSYLQKDEKSYTYQLAQESDDFIASTSYHTLGKEVLEVGKITLLGAVDGGLIGTITYLMSEFFDSGISLRDTGTAGLLGIALGSTSGFVGGLCARWGDDREKLTWHDLVRPMLMCNVLSLTVPPVITVAVMTCLLQPLSSDATVTLYAVGNLFLAGASMGYVAAYTLAQRDALTEDIVQIEPNRVTINLAKWLINEV